MQQSVIVVPNHLPHLDFLKEWDELKGHKIIVVQDIGNKPEIPEGFDIDIYDHEDIEKELGEDSWIIPSQTSACRSFGYYKAWQLKPQTILTLDNDCYPESTEYWVKGHNINLSALTTLDWINTATDLPMRGFPYGIRRKSNVWLSHGLWSNVPDLDGATMLHYPDLRFKPFDSVQTIPRYNFFPMCGMNLAWTVDLTPAMYFGLFGPEYGFDQYDDIWAGVLVKKVLDFLGKGVVSGAPSVEHRKQSKAMVNIKKQAPALGMNEVFWQYVRDIQPTGETVAEVYKSIIEQLPDTMEDEVPEWLPKFKKAALIWVNLFQ